MATEIPFTAFPAGIPVFGEFEAGQVALEPRSRGLPPLENGDCMSREEFERRYDAMPNLKKAELINGEVFVGPPVSIDHGSADGSLAALLGVYSWQTSGTQCLSNTTVRFDDENVVQPDCILRLRAGGTSRVSADNYCEGPPELVVEIASTSVSRDLTTKRRLYARVGVREYIVWRVRDRAINSFELHDGKYEALLPDEHGVFRSRHFPGLWIDAKALLTGDTKRALAVLNEGIAARDGGTA